MGYFECEMLEQRGYLMPEYFCKYTRTQLPKETARDICMTCRHKDCADYKRKSALFPWEL